MRTLAVSSVFNTRQPVFNYFHGSSLPPVEHRPPGRDGRAPSSQRETSFRIETFHIYSPLCLTRGMHIEKMGRHTKTHTQTLPHTRTHTHYIQREGEIMAEEAKILLQNVQATK